MTLPLSAWSKSIVSPLSAFATVSGLILLSCSLSLISASVSFGGSGAGAITASGGVGIGAGVGVWTAVGRVVCLAGLVFGFAAGFEGLAGVGVGLVLTDPGFGGFGAFGLAFGDLRGLAGLSLPGAGIPFPYLDLHSSKVIDCGIWIVLPSASEADLVSLSARSSGRTSITRHLQLGWNDGRGEDPLTGNLFLSIDPHVLHVLSS